MRKGPRDFILSHITWLDEGMVRTFQELTNQLGVSNYRLAGICSWLFAFVVYMHMVQSVKSAQALLGYMIVSALTILCIFAFHTLEHADDETPPRLIALMTAWREHIVGRGLRTLAMLFVMAFLGGNIYSAARHNSGYQWTKVAVIMTVIPVLYLAAGDPPQRRRKIRVRKKK